MAENGYARTNTYTDDDGDWKYLEFNWWIVSQNQVTRQTVIGYSIYGRGNSGYITSRKFKLNFDNKTEWSKEDAINLYEGTLVKSGQHTFQHDIYGKCDFTVYLEAAINSYAVNSTGSKTFTIDDIDVGLVKYGVNNGWKQCEVYRCIDGKWKKVQPYFGSNGEWKQCN